MIFSPASTFSSNAFRLPNHPIHLPFVRVSFIIPVENWLGYRSWTKRKWNCEARLRYSCLLSFVFPFCFCNFFSQCVNILNSFVNPTTHQKQHDYRKKYVFLVKTLSHVSASPFWSALLVSQDSFQDFPAGAFLCGDLGMLSCRSLNLLQYVSFSIYKMIPIHLDFEASGQHNSFLMNAQWYSILLPSQTCTLAISSSPLSSGNTTSEQPQMNHTRSKLFFNFHRLYFICPDSPTHSNSQHSACFLTVTVRQGQPSRFWKQSYNRVLSAKLCWHT